MRTKSGTLPCGKPLPALAPAARAGVGWRTRLEAHLLARGLRKSLPRMKIAETVLAVRGHFTIQEVVRQVQAAHPGIGTATVYRTVNLMAESGILSETLVRTGGEVVYEAAEPGSEDHHDHIVCLDCGAILEFHEARIEKLQESVLERLGFREERHRHVIYARCEQAGARKARS